MISEESYRHHSAGASTNPKRYLEYTGARSPHGRARAHLSISQGVSTASNPRRPATVDPIWIKSFSTTIATILGQAPAFLVPLAVARVLGATAATDAFFLALAIVPFVLNAVSGATQHALVPVLVTLEGPRARALLALVQTRAATITAAAIAAIVLGLALWSPVSVFFVAQLLPFTLAAVLASVWTGALYAQRHYVLASITPAIRSVGVLLTLWWFGGSYGVRALVWGYTVAELCRAALLTFSLAPPRPALLPKGSAARDDLKMFLRTGGAQALGSALLALVPVIDRFYAAMLPDGSVSLLDYAERVCQAPVGLLISGFLVVSLAQWSHDAAQGNSLERLRSKTLRSSIVLCGASLAPITLLFVFRHSVAALLFGRAHLSADALIVLGNTLGGYLIGLPVLLAGMIHARAFLVLRRTDLLAVEGQRRAVGREARPERRADAVPGPPGYRGGERGSLCPRIDRSYLAAYARALDGARNAMTKRDVDLAGRAYWEDVWERTGRHSVGQFLRPSITRSRVCSAAMLTRGAQVCEVGCADSAWIPYFIEQGMRVSGIDYSEKGIPAAPADARTAQPVGEPDLGRHARPGGAADRRERSRLQSRARRTLPRSGRNPSADARSPARRRRIGHGRAQPARVVGIPRRAGWHLKCLPCTCCIRRRSSTQSIGRPASNQWSRRGTSAHSAR